MHIYKKQKKKYLVAWAFITALCLIISGYYFKKEANAFHNNNKKSAIRISMEIDGMLTATEIMTIQLSSSINLAPLACHGVSANILEYKALQDDVALRLSNNPQYLSFYVYFFNNDLVLTADSVYRRKSFYDQEILEKIIRSEKSVWYDFRTMQSRQSGLPQNIISIIRTFPLVSKVPTSAVVVNFDAENIFPNNALELSQKNGLCVSNGITPLAYKNISVSDFDPTLFDFQKSFQKIGSNFIYTADSNHTPLQYHLFVSSQSYQMLLSNSMRRILFFYLLALTLTFILILSISRYYVQDYSRLANKIGKFLQNSAEDVSAHDEYESESTVLDKAIEKMIEKSKNLETSFNEYLPIVRERLLSSWILGHQRELEDIFAQMDYTGISFPHTLFCCLVLEVYNIEDFDNPHSQKECLLFCKTLVEHELSKAVITYGVILSKSRIAFVANYPVYVNLADCTKTLRERLPAQIENEIHVSAILSMGSVDETRYNLHHSYCIASKNLNCKTFNRFYFPSPGSFLATEALYPTALHLKILEQIQSDSLVDQMNNVAVFFSSFGENLSLSALQGYSVLLISNILNELIPYGLWVKEDFPFECINRIFNTKDFPSLQHITETILSELQSSYNNATSLKKPEENKYVLCTKRYIQQNLHSDISIAEIASAVHLNPRYLGKLFKDATGNTLIEYLNKLRIAEAKILLYSTKQTICAIAEEIGYSDVRAFIRYFKKYENTTPNEFRANRL